VTEPWDLQRDLRALLASPIFAEAAHDIGVLLADSDFVSRVNANRAAAPDATPACSLLDCIGAVAAVVGSAAAIIGTVAACTTTPVGVLVCGAAIAGAASATVATGVTIAKGAGADNAPRQVVINSASCHYPSGCQYQGMATATNHIANTLFSDCRYQVFNGPTANITYTLIEPCTYGSIQYAGYANSQNVYNISAGDNYPTSRCYYLYTPVVTMRWDDDVQTNGNGAFRNSTYTGGC